MQRRTPVLAPAAAALVLAVVGCTATPSSPSVQVSARDVTVTVASGDGDPTMVEEESVPAEEGAVVETDDAGLAELVYPDGSLTRLGPDTLLTIVELSTAEAQRTVLQLDVGRTWHRVEALVAEDSAYEVQTPVGVAAVRGTEFTVECTAEPSCRIVVLEGSVEFTPTDGEPILLEPFQILVVPSAEGQPAPAGFPVDAITADEWLSENVEVDALEPDGVQGSLAGVWQVRSVLTASTRATGEVGRTVDVQWTIEPPVCGPTCVSSIASSGGSTFTLEYLADGYRFTAAQVGNCFDPATGETLDPDHSDIAVAGMLEVTGSDADGNPVSLTGSRTDVLTKRADPHPTCVDLPPVAEDTYELTLTR